MMKLEIEHLLGMEGMCPDSLAAFYNRFPDGMPLTPGGLAKYFALAHSTVGDIQPVLKALKLSDPEIESAIKWIYDLDFDIVPSLFSEALDYAVYRLVNANEARVAKRLKALRRRAEKRIAALVNNARANAIDTLIEEMAEC